MEIRPGRKNRDEYSVADGVATVSVLRRDKSCIRFLIDESDTWVLAYKWSPMQSGNGGRHWYFQHGNGGKSVKLHRLLSEAKDGDIVDHINGNTLDNRKSNLRIVTRSQNMQNCRLRTTNKSGYRNVSRDKVANSWRVSIKANGVYHFIGYFKDIEKANEAAIDARRRLHIYCGRDTSDP